MLSILDIEYLLTVFIAVLILYFSNTKQGLKKLSSLCFQTFYQTFYVKEKNSTTSSTDVPIEVS